MGLFSSGKVAEKIEYTQERKDEIVRRVPYDKIRLGSQLIVHQGQASVFYRDGKSLDTFGPGRHTLVTANLPLVTNLMEQVTNYAFGDDSIFSAVVYFVSMREFPQEGWGTRQPIAMQTPGIGLGWLLLGAHGTYGFEISDAKLVVDTFVGGGQDSLKLKQVKTRLTNAIVQAGTDWFAEVNPGNLMKAQSMMDEMATAVKIKAKDQFEAMGMTLKNVTIGGLSPLETSADKLRNMGLLDAGMYERMYAMDSMRDAAQGEGGGGAAGMGMGMGAGMGMGQMMSGMFGNMQQQQQAPQQAAPQAVPAGPKEWPAIMGVTEAAEYIGVEVEDVVELCMSGDLKAKKIGSKYRISKTAIDTFMSE
ncbi:SPFH domain-containing protein [Anaerolineales bacterium HSG25]|nr:SPFH domain-containing protein [Anaerolineales bacterium HSG25]